VIWLCCNISCIANSFIIDDHDFILTSFVAVIAVMFLVKVNNTNRHSKTRAEQGKDEVICVNSFLEVSIEAPRVIRR